MINYEIPDYLKEAIEGFLYLLEQNGWELNDDGDIVEKDTKELVMEKYFRGKNEE